MTLNVSPPPSLIIIIIILLFLLIIGILRLTHISLLVISNFYIRNYIRKLACGEMRHVNTVEEWDEEHIYGCITKLSILILTNCPDNPMFK